MRKSHENKHKPKRENKTVTVGRAEQIPDRACIWQKMPDWKLYGYNRKRLD